MRDQEGEGKRLHSLRPCTNRQWSHEQRLDEWLDAPQQSIILAQTGISRPAD